MRQLLLDGERLPAKTPPAAASDHPESEPSDSDGEPAREDEHKTEKPKTTKAAGILDDKSPGYWLSCRRGSSVGASRSDAVAHGLEVPEQLHFGTSAFAIIQFPFGGLRRNRRQWDVSL